jgi:hypothetical protein
VASSRRMPRPRRDPAAQAPSHLRAEAYNAVF